MIGVGDKLGLTFFQNKLAKLLEDTQVGYTSHQTASGQYISGFVHHVGHLVGHLVGNFVYLHVGQFFQIFLVGHHVSHHVGHLWPSWPTSMSTTMCISMSATM